jgi:AraC-like DNA-binding protein
MGKIFFLKAYHSFHKANEAPESYCIVLLNSIDRCQQITHALNVAQIAIVFVVSEKHILHLFEMDVCACFREW